MDNPLLMLVGGDFKLSSTQIKLQQLERAEESLALLLSKIKEAKFRLIHLESLSSAPITGGFHKPVRKTRKPTNYRALQTYHGKEFDSD